MRCAKCDTGFYLTNGHCCEDTKYWDIMIGVCKLISEIDAVTYADCVEIDDKNVCVKCAANKFLKSDNTCKTPASVVDNCSKYDD
jgi:hypothetical protein